MFPDLQSRLYNCKVKSRILELMTRHIFVDCLIPNIVKLLLLCTTINMTSDEAQVGLELNSCSFLIGTLSTLQILQQRLNAVAMHFPRKSEESQ